MMWRICHIHSIQYPFNFFSFYKPKVLVHFLQSFAFFRLGFRIITTLCFLFVCLFVLLFLQILPKRRCHFSSNSFAYYRSVSVRNLTIAVFKTAGYFVLHFFSFLVKKAQTNINSYLAAISAQLKGLLPKNEAARNIPSNPRAIACLYYFKYGKRRLVVNNYLDVIYFLTNICKKNRKKHLFQSWNRAEK